MYGLDNRDLKASARLTLLTQSQIMKQNGRSEGEIKAYADTFRKLPDISGIGGDFVAMLGRMGYALPLFLLMIRIIA